MGADLNLSSAVVWKAPHVLNKYKSIRKTNKQKEKFWGFKYKLEMNIFFKILNYNTIDVNCNSQAIYFPGKYIASTALYMGFSILVSKQIHQMRALREVSIHSAGQMLDDVDMQSMKTTLQLLYPTLI